MQPLALSLTGLAPAAFATLVDRLRPAIVRRRGRPWALPFERRVLVACTSLRTNLTVRELGAVFGISPTQAHRIVTDIVRHLAALGIAAPPDLDRGHTWVVDGTLVPTRDHRAAARLKDWRILRDHRRRGARLAESLRALAPLHNLKTELRNVS